MNKQLLGILSFAAISFRISAQVQIDKPIDLNGVGANAKITGIKSVTSAQDAVSVEVLQGGSLVYSSSAGTSAAYTLTLAPVLGGYTTGMEIRFKAHAANAAGVVTIDVNGLGAKAIKKDVSANLAAGDIQIGQLVTLAYDGVNFQLISRTTDANSGGTVTSVTGTAPIVSSGGNAPAISIPVATSSSNGYLSSTDWNTFNNKYSGSGATNTIAKFTGTSTVGNSGITDDGTTVNTSEQFDVTGGTGADYNTAPIEIRTNNNPRISFHRPGFVASQLGMDASAVIRTYDNPGTGYEQFAASNIFANGYLSVNGASDASGNIRFSAANPYITASSYFVAPGGAYFNSGTVYFQSQAQFRAGIHNDGAPFLQIDGGTSSDTYFPGRVGIGVTGPAKRLHIVSPNGDNEQIRLSPTGGNSAAVGQTSGIDFWSTFVSPASDQGPRRTATIRAYYTSGAWTTEALSFYVGVTSGANDAANLPNERMRINANANPQVVGSWVALSDARLKTDVQDLRIGLAEVMKLKPVSYNFHDPGGFEFAAEKLTKVGKADLGFIAQDLFKVIPEVVELPKSENSLYGVKYEKLIPVLTKAIQEQQTEIEQLKVENSSLKASGNTQQTLINSLKAEIDLIKERLSIKTQK